MGKMQILLCITYCSQNYQFGPSKNWLFLTAAELIDSILANFNEINLQLNSYCELGIYYSNGSIRLLDVYKTGKNANITMHELGFWNSSTPSQIQWLPKKYKYFQRQNLQGYNLQAVTVQVNEFYIQTKRSFNKYEVSGGYFGNLFINLQKLLNFTYSLKYMSGYSYGNLKDGHNWTGIIGVLQRKEADITACEISLVNERLNAIGFSLPMHHVALRLYAHLGAKILMYQYYWQPYSGFSWAALIMFLFIMVILKRIFQLLVNRCLGENVYSNWLPDLFCFTSMALQQGTSDPLHFSLRILQWSAAITFVIVYIAYGAKLTSTSTVNQNELPITDLQGILNDGWKLLIVKDSLGHRIFQESSPASIEGGIWRTQLSIDRSRFVRGVGEGLNKVLMDANYVFLGHEDSCLQMLNRNFTSEGACQLGFPAEKIFPSLLSFGIQKDSPYQKLINFHLLRLNEVGVSRRLLEKWIPQYHSCPHQTHESAELADVLPIFIILVCGLVISIFILVLEICVNARNATMKKSKRMKARRILLKRLNCEHNIMKYYDRLYLH